MFSTREWIQFLQYKLTPDREKDLFAHSESDPFLKDALDSIGVQENRPIAFQSLSYLISVIEENTGVSESKIAKGETKRASSSDSSMGLKIALGLGGLILLGLIGFGIYYFINQQNQSDDIEQSVSTVDTLATLPAQSIDSSSQPFEVIPNAAPAIDTVAKTTTISSPINAASRPTTSVKKQITPTVATSTTIVTSPNSDKERILFNQAQDAYKNGNKEEAKKILNTLKSYDNPMKTQAESILKSISQ